MTQEPKSSETDPPAANQAVGEDDAAEPSQSNNPPGDEVAVQSDPQVVPGKPDGEVDTRM